MAVPVALPVDSTKPGAPVQAEVAAPVRAEVAVPVQAEVAVPVALPAAAVAEAEVTLGVLQEALEEEALTRQSLSQELEAIRVANQNFARSGSCPITFAPPPLPSYHPHQAVSPQPAP